MIEPEEIIESGLCSALAESGLSNRIDIIGALAPVDPGELKSAALSCVSVTADVTSQDIDWQEGAGLPRTYSVRVALRIPQSDDKTGVLFRDSARIVRQTLGGFLGNGCAALNADGFLCDAFILDSTATAIEQMDGDAVYTKTYNITINGRYIPPAE